MGFYFNTFRQQQGDKASNEQKYEEAHNHYSEALKTLYLHAASNSFQHTDFYDALVYVLSEVLRTKLILIRLEAQNSNFDAVAKYWLDIPGMLHEMELVYKEHVEGPPHLFSNQEEVVMRTNALLATVCEEVSDELVDQLEENEDEETILTQSQETLSKAIEWMNRAINFQIKTKASPDLSSSLGYLNLLERQYKKTGARDNLQIMSTYIKHHKLLEEPMEFPLQRLELLSYVVRLAVVNGQNIDGLTLECQTLYATLDDEEKENPILDDLRDLIKLMPQEEKKNGTEEEEEELNESGNKDMSIDEGKLEIDLTVDEFEDPAPNPDGVDMLIDSTPAHYVPLSMPTAKQLMSSGNQSVAAQSSTISSPHRFFVLPSQQPVDELPHSRALQTALKKITTDSTNPKFLANLLCLISDFFSRYQARRVQKQNAIVLAFDLYQQVIKMDPKHHRANMKLKDLPLQHRQLLGSYEHYSQKPRSPIPTTIQISEVRNCFNQAIEELTIQLESLLMSDNKKIQETLNNLIHFIGEQLANGAITNVPSPEIRALLMQTYQEELKNSASIENRSVFN
ncbi:Uncharacterised protein [Legionella steigerwaltii]|uniref:Uncharacterized protein n=1 Tax=Legionella steigerwaltii TaxID=460 RepID=A0A378L6H0_9GAMM|nr:hypothetical protein [Legionella steigerwaltii]KTD80334.1 hypothetical protein Lstg_0596 [Legionella steigerwaltii]STY22416.1 Uncharacterised protein [Legionella steigerwaltii]